MDEIDAARVGLAGHSQAGWEIPLAASRETALRFAVIFAGTAVTADGSPVNAVRGFFDMLANTLFAVASTRGLLPVVAVGGSMYPAFTIALAHFVLGERLTLLQRLGVVGALAGVALIAGGS